METRSLTELADRELDKARGASSGRAAVTVFGGREHDLRQTLIALADGHSLGEHEAPGEATLLVLRGAVRLTAGTESCEAREGDHLVIPPARHDLLALTDSAVLLTVASRATAGVTPS